MTERAPSNDELVQEIRQMRRDMSELRSDVREVRQATEANAELYQAYNERLEKFEAMQIHTRTIVNNAVNHLAVRILDIEAQYKQLMELLTTLNTNLSNCHQLIRRAIIGAGIVFIIVVLVLAGIYVF